MKLIHFEDLDIHMSNVPLHVFGELLIGMSPCGHLPPGAGSMEGAENFYTFPLPSAGFYTETWDCTTEIEFGAGREHEWVGKVGIPC